MKAVILVGGEGTRLRPLTINVPKPMVPILNKPFLERMLEYLRGHGIDEVILALWYLPNRIRDYFGDGDDFGVRLHYVIEDSPLGTAGAVKNVEHLLDETFFVFNGDILMDIDLERMLSFHHRKRAKATIALTAVNNPSAYGVVDMNTSRRVLRFIEKPAPGTAPSNLVNAGCYILDPDALDYAPKGKRFMFEHHLFPQMINRGLVVFGFPSKGYWMDIGTPANYLKINRDLLKGGIVKEGDSFIHPSARIKGPLLLGQGCHIGADVKIHGPTVLGHACFIDEGATINGAVLWNRVRVGARSTVEGCILGDDAYVDSEVFIGPGCVVADGARILSRNRLERGVAIWPRVIVPPESISFISGG